MCIIIRIIMCIKICNQLAKMIMIINIKIKKGPMVGSATSLTIQPYSNYNIINLR